METVPVMEFVGASALPMQDAARAMHSAIVIACTARFTITFSKNALRYIVRYLFLSQRY